MGRRVRKVLKPKDAPSETFSVEEFTLRCPVCGGADMMRIAVRMARQQLYMSSCPLCEARWWDDEDGQKVNLGGVLALAARDGRRRR